jgi:hypothetical protein
MGHCGENHATTQIINHVKDFEIISSSWYLAHQLKTLWDVVAQGCQKSSN